jgi:D-glucosaminate-specific PTS system IIB component
MGDISMTRVDFRLVHGQVGGQWLKYLNVPRVVILCDEIADDPFLIEMFGLAVPTGVKIVVFKIEDGVEQWKKDRFGAGNYILLFKHLADAKRAYDLGLRFEKVNLGQIPASPDPGGAERKRALRTVFISKTEAEIVKALSSEGVNIYSQGAPIDSPVDMLPIVNKI